MSYSQTDLTDIESAILKLQKGERVASVTYDGKTIRYTDVQLNDLLALRDRMRAELASSNASRVRQIRLNPTSGF